MNGKWASVGSALHLGHAPWRPYAAGEDRYRIHSNTHRHAIPHWVFAITLAATLSMGWALHVASNEAHLFSVWIHHTHEVLRTISNVEEHLERAEASVRGHVLSGSASFLIERDNAITTLGDNLIRLKALVLDHPEQHDQAVRLDGLIARRVAIMYQTARQYDSAGADAAATTLRAAQQLSMSIYDLTRSMESLQQDLLELRRRGEDQRHAQTMALLVAAGALALLIIIPSYIAFALQSRARSRVERTLYEMADSIPGVVYQYRSRADGASHYEFLSSGVEELYGIKREAALRDASVIGDIVLDEDRAGLSSAVASAAEKGLPLQHDFRVKTRRGGLTWVRSSAAPRRERDGSIVWNGHWADITRQKQLEQALHEAKEVADTASRAKSTFLAVMSHEIRTPLNGVLGMLELLSLTQMDAEQRATLSVVRESGRSLQRIIDDILDFSKIEAGKLDICPEPSSVREVVESTRNIYAGNASSKGLLIKCSVDPHIRPALVVDPLRLGQILNNLVSNAVKFTSEGTVEIRADVVASSGTEETVRFSVIDSGPGISREMQARLFAPFMQGAAGTTRAFGGTGLGLTISRRLSDMMGGSIEIQSEVGKGTAMILTLQLAVADPRDLPETGTATSQVESVPDISLARTAPRVEDAEREKTLVLLVDDHPVNRMLLLRQVNALGYAAEPAQNGVEALEKWESGRFAAIITDCHMPEMDGYELSRRIRTRESERHLGRTPVIACTANALRGEAEACLEAGMDDYLAKPVPLSELKKKLDQWLPLPPVDERQNDHDTVGFIDHSALASVTGGEAESEREILADLQRANDDDAGVLKQAAQRKDFDAVARASHRMKGANKMVGLTALAAACEHAERAGMARDVDAVRRFVDEIERERLRANRYIDTVCEAESHT